MNNLHQHLNTAANELSLSVNEKSAMRRELLRAMRATAVPSPYFHTLFARGFAAFAVILVVGSGTAFAAEGAVPGDILYTVKTDVTEPVRTALAVSNEQKASWNTSLVERRAFEAETLTSEGRLSETDAVRLAVDMEASAAAAQSAVEKVAIADPSDADELSVELDSSLSAHGALLSELRDTSNDERTKTAASNFTNFFRNWRQGARVAIATKEPEPQSNAGMATFATTLSVVADSGTEISAATTAPEAAPAPVAKTKAAAGYEYGNNDTATGTPQLHSSASRAVDQARNRFESLRDSLDESTVEKVEDRLSRIEQALEDAGSSKALTQVASDATTLNTFLSASSKLNRRDLLTPVIQKWNTHRGGDDFDNEDDD